MSFFGSTYFDPGYFGPSYFGTGGGPPGPGTGGYFGANYFGASHFGPNYFGQSSAQPGTGGYYGASYFGPNYFGPNYFGEGPIAVPPSNGLIRPAVAAILENIPAVASAVGGNVYFGAAPQGIAYPWVVYSVDDRSFGHNLGGVDGTSLATIDIQIATLAAPGEAQADAIAQAIRRGLDCIAPGFYSGCYIVRSLIADESDDQIPPKAGGGQWLSLINLSFDILHRV